MASHHPRPASVAIWPHILQVNPIFMIQGRQGKLLLMLDLAMSKHLSRSAVASKQTLAKGKDG